MFLRNAFFVVKTIETESETCSNPIIEGDSQSSAVRVFAVSYLLKRRPIHFSAFSSVRFEFKFFFKVSFELLGWDSTIGKGRACINLI